jgi:type IV secretory pathway VirJ component
MHRRMLAFGAALALAPLAVIASEPPPALARLPLVVFPVAAQQPERFALLLTGDGGFARLPRDLSDGLNSAGIPVVGLNSRRYFHQRRTPEETAADVAEILGYYLRQWAHARLVLIGYSRGADVLPFVINRLPPAMQQRIELAALLNPATQTRFVLGQDYSPADSRHAPRLPLLPEVTALTARDGIDVLCLYGSGDKHALCPTLAPERYVVRAIGHGHHFSGDYAALVDAILSRLGPDQTRTAAPAHAH